jgi:hypothetical protein
MVILRKLANLIYAFPEGPILFDLHLEWSMRVAVNLKFFSGRTVSHKQVRFLCTLNVDQCLAAAP